MTLLMESPARSRFSNRKAFKPFPLLFRRVREEYGLSQTAFAKKIGIERTKLIRLEKKVWEEIPIGELQLLAKGLALPLSQLIQKYGDDPAQSALSRFHLDRPPFSVQIRQGCRLQVYTHQKPYAVCSMKLAAHETVTADKFPAEGAFAFYFVLEGEILLQLAGQEHFFREKECFCIKPATDWEIYNPSQLKPAVLLMFSMAIFQ